MYSTCLFCNSSLGKNEALEIFPVGRRLAFDEAKGRLWVVCRKCERWNLSPLEARWEAIEECERLFRATRMRVSTDEIGLAKLKEGLELVRIGEPQRPEMAAWRYGDQFGRRRRRMLMYGAGAVAVGSAVVVAGPMLGLIGGGMAQPVFQLGNAARSIYLSRKKVLLHDAIGAPFEVRALEVAKTRLNFDDGVLRVDVVTHEKNAKSRSFQFDSGKSSRSLTGDDAIRAAGALLPMLNASGGSAADVARAVDRLEAASSTEELFRTAAASIRERERGAFGGRSKGLLKKLPTEGRLALEMAVHEESERRALEGELHILAAAWKDAEVIAAIADNLLVEPGVSEAYKAMRAEHDRQSGERG